MTKTFRKVEVHLDDKFGVPECYVQFFKTDNKQKPESQEKQKPSGQNYLVTIEIQKNPRKNKQLLTLLYIHDECTTIDRNSFQHELPSLLNATTSTKNIKGKKAIEIRGDHHDKLINVFKNQYHMTADVIEYIPLPIEQPEVNDGTKFIVKPKFPQEHKHPEDLPSPIAGNPLNCLRGKNYNSGTYANEMKETIEFDTREQEEEYEKMSMDTYLAFKAGPVRQIKEGKNSVNKRCWAVAFDIKDRLNIDDFVSGKLLAPMDKIIVTCKDSDLPPQAKKYLANGRNSRHDHKQQNLFSITGIIENIEKSKIEASFLLLEKLYIPDYIPEGPVESLPKNFMIPDPIVYHVTFRPNLAVCSRSALALLTMQKTKKNNLKKLIADSFERKDIHCSRQRPSKLPDDFDAGFDLTNSRHLTDEELQDPQFKNKLIFNPEGNQASCVESAIQNNLCLIQGPPGCGKSQIIASILYNLFKHVYNVKSKNRILVCAYSNMAVSNIIKFIGPVAKAMGKKLIWLASSTKDFKTKDSYEKASGETTYLTFYQIMKRNTQEGEEFRKYQEQIWERKFSAFDRDKLQKIRMTIERNLIAEADIVCCTTAMSAAGAIKNFKFSTYILDEATQSNEIASIIPLIHQPERMILLGDQKQLDPMASKEMKQRHPETSQSLFARLVNNAETYGLDCQMLDVQYRMHPKICDFPNRAFYDNSIQSQTGLSNRRYIDLSPVGLMAPLQFIDVENCTEERAFLTSYQNTTEAAIVVDIVDALLNAGIKGNQIGVITPYLGQVKLIRKLLGQRKTIHSSLKKGLKVAPVDRFQGSERDVIILSFVRNNPRGELGFLSDKRRLNVSITRARCSLIVIGNRATLSHDPTYKSLCNSFSKCTVKNSDLHLIKKSMTTMDIINQEGSIKLDGIKVSKSPQKSKLVFERNQESSIFKSAIKFFTKPMISLPNPMSLVWPDDIDPSTKQNEAKILLTKWVQNRIPLLNKQKQVTLSLHVTNMFIEIREIYNNTFDLLGDVKKLDQDQDHYEISENEEDEDEDTFGSDNDEDPDEETHFEEEEDDSNEIIVRKQLAPSIENLNGFIIFLYNKNTDDKGSNVKQQNTELIEIIKPLLEHQKVTIITHNLIDNLTLLSSYGIEIRTQRFIDTELFDRPKSSQNLISGQESQPIKTTICDVHVTKDYYEIANNMILDPKYNDVQTDVYNDLVLRRNPEIPITALITESYLNTHCVDGFYSSIICSEIYNRLSLIPKLYKLTKQRLQEYRKIITESHEPAAPLFHQHLFFIRDYSSEIENLVSIDLYSNNELIEYWKICQRIHKALNLCSPKYISQFVRIQDKLVVQRMEEIEDKLFEFLNPNEVIDKCKLARPDGYTPAFT